MKILVVLPRFPYPLEKGDKLRAYNQIRELSKHNEIYLFCVSHSKVLPEHVEAVRPFCKEIRVVHSPRLINYKNIVRNYFSTKSLQLGYWDSRYARKAFKEFQNAVSPDVLYSQMVRTMPLVSRSQVPKVMDFQDALSMNTERRMEQSRGLWHYILHFEFKMLRSTEYNSFKIFDALTIISEPDSDAIPHMRNSDIHIVPNGVDFDYFTPQAPSANSQLPTANSQYDIVFCGNMSYEPNIRAAQYLINQVMPFVWDKRPDTRVLLAGAYPRHNITSLASPQVTVSGYVDDIRECYASARIFAAPMQTGSGLQNKLLEAMSMKIPCVTTSIANASLHATPDHDVLVGDNPLQFAEHLLALLDDSDRRNTLAENGYRFVHDNYSWERSCEKLEQILTSVASLKTSQGIK